MENEKIEWQKNPHVSMEVMTPIEQRIAAERPQLSQGLAKLRELLGEEKFIKYISPLHNITKNKSTLLLVAANVLQRSHIERECIPQIKKAFDVVYVRVVG